MDWSKYPNFKPDEFKCRETGELNMNPDFMAKLQQLRGIYGKPMRITSGYRSARHSIEASKPFPGHHAHGIAVDIGCSGQDAYRILEIALQIGFNGIGVAQKKGVGNFIHLDTASRQSVWSY